MSNLIIQNFRLGTKRSSIKLENEMWQSFAEICLKLNVNKNCMLSTLAEYKELNFDKYDNTTFTSFVRVFIVRALNNGLSNTAPDARANQADVAHFVGTLMSHDQNADRRSA